MVKQHWQRLVYILLLVAEFTSMEPHPVKRRNHIVNVDGSSQKYFFNMMKTKRTSSTIA